MKNLWNKTDAEKYIKKYSKLGINEDIALRVYTSHLIGCNEKLVLHGGGNTSVKTKISDIDGDQYDVICVKGSGWDLSNIEPEGLPAVKLKPLLKLKNKNNISDTDMVSYQKRNLLNIDSPNPSVETFLHAFLPHKYVDHTHSNAILSLTNRPSGASLCRKIFDDKVMILPYIMPGFDLARAVYKCIKLYPKINCLILMNHGIFTFAETAKGSYDLMIKYVNNAERYLSKSKKRKSVIDKKFRAIDIAEIMPIIRGCVSSKNKYISSFRKNSEIIEYMNNSQASSYMSKGTITPDHVIRIKPFPLFIKSKDLNSTKTIEKIINKHVSSYEQKYKSYFHTNNKKSKIKKIMLDTNPNIIFLQNIGMVSIGRTKKDAEIAADIAEQNISVISKIQETSKFKTISKKDLFDMEYWSLEQAKIKKEKQLLCGNIIVITGALGKIGYATYKLFKDKGAEVILLDNNKALIKEFLSNHKDMCLYCDVTDSKSVNTAFMTIIKEYGGIDIVVSNAGTAPQGLMAEVTSESLKRSFEINFFSHQTIASVATRIMLKQKIKGCLLFNISKQSVNPGKAFGPYGLPKAALLNLCKQYAVDYGMYGIRSNGVNADRIKSGMLNDKLILNRSKARGVSKDQYMRGNLLQEEVLATDVANAFYSLAVSEKTTGTVLTVDGGNVAASFR
tara:strand:+ start:1393 stop:3417 length:2025 start_codon:yes stop_codon:yes gene_type:complete